MAVSIEAATFSFLGQFGLGEGLQEMKRSILFFALILMAVPLFAQDGDGGGGFGGMFGMGDSPRGANAPPPDRLVQLRKILLDAKYPLAPDQEKTLSNMLERDIKQYTVDLEKKFPEEVALARAAGAQQGRGGGRPGAGGGGDRGNFAGGRGGGGGGEGRGGPGGARGGGLPPNSPMLAEMNRINQELQNKVLTALKPEQQAAFKKFQTDEIKKAGGFGALKLNMEEAGTPLTAEQETQIQALYTEQDQQRRQLMRDAAAQGQVDRAKIDAQLNAELAPKLVKVLNAGQRKTLLDAMKKAAPQQ